MTLQGKMPLDAKFQQYLCADSHNPCADTQGFSLHAVVRYGAD